MGKLSTRLSEQYTDHYRRVNSEIRPAKASQRRLRNMELMYGSLVRSLPQGSRVLDLGCGTGHLLYWLSQQRNIIPVGVDGSESQLAIARESLPKVELSCEDGLAYLKRHPDTFHGIFCTDVLEHLPDIETRLEWVDAARQALRQNGFFFCRVPNAANLTGSYSRYMDLTHNTVFTRTSILQLLEAGGLRDCRIAPVRAAHVTGRLRLLAEHTVHKCLFLLCGRGLETVFTSNVNALGFKRDARLV